LLNTHVLVLLVACRHNKGLHFNINVTHLGLIAIEDLGNLLERRPARLDVEDSDEDKFKEDPALVTVSNALRTSRAQSQRTA